jgi:hypothetical protein
MTQLDTFVRDLGRFCELYEKRLWLEGAPPAGLQEVADLKALHAVFAGERPFRGQLLRLLSGFSNMLASGALPPEFSRANFGDACVALGEVLESKGTLRWRFDPDVRKRAAAELGLQRAGPGLDKMQRDNQGGWQRHAQENVRFILSALERVPAAGTAVIAGAARSHDLPLDRIAARFERVIVVDVCEASDTHANAARAISDPAALERVTVERFDLTGSYNQFVSDVGAIVSRAKSESDAEREIDELVSGYDVQQRTVRLCREEVEPDLAVSSMVLTQLGLPFKPFVTRAFRARGFRPERVSEGVLGESLAALACRVEQQHISALLRVPKLAVLTSDVRESPVTLGPDGELVALGAPRSQLSVPSLSGRIPSRARPLAEAEWDWLRVVPKRPGAPGALMDVEGVVLARSG